MLVDIFLLKQGGCWGHPRRELHKLVGITRSLVASCSTKLKIMIHDMKDLDMVLCRA